MADITSNVIKRICTSFGNFVKSAKFYEFKTQKSRILNLLNMCKKLNTSAVKVNITASRSRNSMISMSSPSRLSSMLRVLSTAVERGSRRMSPRSRRNSDTMLRSRRITSSNDDVDDSSSAVLTNATTTYTPLHYITLISI